MADSVGSVLAEAAAALAKAGCDQPRRRARQLAAGALNLSAAELLLDPQRNLDSGEAQRLAGLVKRMIGGEPLSRLLGRREFWGLDFELSPDTLDPRPDSETLVEAVLARMDRRTPLTLLDLGTGSGCLLLALLSELPAAIGVGVDLSPAAAAMARRNAHRLQLADRCFFLAGNWGDAIGHRFDVVVTNPPYIATPMLRELPAVVRCYDPPCALDGGQDGLAAYRGIVASLTALLTPAGLFVAEIGADQAVDVVAMLTECGLFCEAVERDLAGLERCVVARSTRSYEVSTSKKTLECGIAASRVTAGEFDATRACS
jgi:release factor glutamine methyltransferase